MHIMTIITNCGFQCCSHLSVDTTSIKVGFIILNTFKPECTYFAGIMLNAFAYYAQNYADIIGASLLCIHSDTNSLTYVCKLWFLDT